MLIPLATSPVPEYPVPPPTASHIPTHPALHHSITKEWEEDAQTQESGLYHYSQRGGGEGGGKKCKNQNSHILQAPWTSREGTVPKSLAACLGMEVSGISLGQSADAGCPPLGRVVGAGFPIEGGASREVNCSLCWEEGADGVSWASCSWRRLLPRRGERSRQPGEGAAGCLAGWLAGGGRGQIAWCRAPKGCSGEGSAYHHYLDCQPLPSHCTLTRCIIMMGP